MASRNAPIEPSREIRASLISSSNSSGNAMISRKPVMPDQLGSDPSESLAMSTQRCNQRSWLNRPSSGTKWRRAKASKIAIIVMISF